MDALVSFFNALADPNRIRIVSLLLGGGELCVCDIERALRLPQARVSRHLTLLRAARVVSARRSGQWMHYSLTADDPLRRAVYRELRRCVAADPDLARDLASLQRCGTSCPPAPVSGGSSDGRSAASDARSGARAKRERRHA